MTFHQSLPSAIASVLVRLLWARPLGGSLIAPLPDQHVMTQHQTAAAAICLLSMVAPAIGHPVLGDYLSVAADLLAWHADVLPDPRDLLHYLRLLVVAWWRSRRRRSSR